MGNKIMSFPKVVIGNLHRLGTTIRRRSPIETLGDDLYDFCRHAQTLRAADSASHRFSCRHAELDSASAVIKRPVMPEGSYPAYSYLMNNEIPDQVRDDNTFSVRDDGRGGNNETLKQVQGDGILGVRDDGRGGNDEIPDQVRDDNTFSVRDDNRGNKTMSFPKVVIGNLHRLETATRRRSPIETFGDDGKKYNSHSKLDLESHRFFDNNGFTLIELLVVVLARLNTVTYAKVMVLPGESDGVSYLIQ